MGVPQRRHGRPGRPYIHDPRVVALLQQRQEGMEEAEVADDVRQ
jgi:uncharacterized protein (DUF433 family)